MTVETPGDPGGALSRYGIEEFVADNVVLLRNVREGSFRRRTVEVLKMRGAMHHKGDVGFTIVPGRGVVVLPVQPAPHAGVAGGTRAHRQRRAGRGCCAAACCAARARCSPGRPAPGRPCWPRSSRARARRAASGCCTSPTRRAPTRCAATRAPSATTRRRTRRRACWRSSPIYPEVASLDDHLVEVSDRIAARGRARLVVDSLSALERVGSEVAYREFVIGITSYVRTLGLASVMTASSSQLVGGTSVTESHISGLIDAIVLLRHVETASSLRRGILVLKARGIDHEHEIRELRPARRPAGGGRALRRRGGRADRPAAAARLTRPDG